MADVIGKTVSMQLKMVGGINDDGTTKYQTRSISGINPNLSADNFSAAADSICTLFSTACHGVHRVINEEIM